MRGRQGEPGRSLGRVERGEIVVPVEGEQGVPVAVGRHLREGAVREMHPDPGSVRHAEDVRQNGRDHAAVRDHGGVPVPVPAGQLPEAAQDPAPEGLRPLLAGELAPPPTARG